MIQDDKFNLNEMMISYNGYHRRKSDICQIISDNDGMFWSCIEDANNDTMMDHIRDHYFQAGEEAINQIIRGVLSSNLSIVKNVLDLACGHGRVLRHLVKLFINAKFSAADIDEDGVDFSVEQFGVKGIYTPVNIYEFDFNDHYDLIWAGSLFTHLPLEKIIRTTAHVCNYLTPRGIFIFTLHGRYSDNEITFSDEEDTEVQNAINQFKETGFGFYNFDPTKLIPGEHQHSSMERYLSLSRSIPDYGMSFSMPSRIVHEIECMENLQIFSYRENGWVGSHDIMVIGRMT